MNTLLFSDDWFLENRINVIRKQGKPEWRRDAIFEQSGIEGLGNFPTVERLGSGRWRAFYWSYRGGVRLLLAESEDGFMWHPSHVKASLKPRSKKFRNEVFHGRENCFTDSGPVFIEPHETDSRHRYKTLYVEYSKGWQTVECGVATSPDGFNWHMKKIPWHTGWPDPPYCIFWRAADESYVISCRPSFNDRRIAFVETADWKTFTPPQLTLHPKPTDPPLVQYFGMPVFPYGAYYIGLLWFLHCDPYEVKESKIEGGIDCHLTYSYDGRMFNHCLAEPFILRNTRGQHGSGCIYPSSMVEDDHGTLRIYSGSSYGEHFHERMVDNAAFLLHTLRKDGFVYLESYSNTGWMMTRPFRLRAPHLALNVRAPHGRVRVQLSDPQGVVCKGFSYEECIPFNGEDLFYQPRWKNKSVHNVVGNWIRIGIELNHTELYAIRGDFEAYNAQKYFREWPDAIRKWERLRIPDT